MSDAAAKEFVVAQVGDIPAGEIVQVEIEGEQIAVYCLDDGSHWATADLCTHGQAFLSEGWLTEDGQIECPLHNGCFDIRTGEPTELPCEVAIRTYPVRIEGDQVILTFKS